jgi:hypothetical protein
VKPYHNSPSLMLQHPSHFVEVAWIFAFKAIQMIAFKETLTTQTRSVSQYRKQQKDTVAMEGVIGSPSVIEDSMS